MNLDISRNATGMIVCACCGALVGDDEIELGVRKGAYICGEIRVCSKACAREATGEAL